MNSFRKTKIVCTLGPASSSPEMVEKLIDAGMNVARLNFSHGSHSDHTRMFNLIRKTSEKKGVYIGILQDLQGPKIRIGKVCNVSQGGLPLEPGHQIAISVDPALADNHSILSTTYPNLANDLKPSDRLLLDDGRLELSVDSIEGPIIRTTVVTGGILKSSKGINLPGVMVSATSPTPRDMDDLILGLELGVDFVALSFVRTPDEILSVKREIHRRGLRTRVIAKIERPEAMDNLEAIMEVSDGIMVARGDLGVEMGPHMVPPLQKKILKRAAYHGKFVITATQMLESMISAPTPTRAEASDVANAVLDGSSAVMLSAETASGSYPVETVKMMKKIIMEVEPLVEPIRGHCFSPGLMQENAVSSSAVNAAELLGARAIVAFTQTGATALSISKYRSTVPVIGASPSRETLRRASIYWGVEPMEVPVAPDTDTMSSILEEHLLSDSRFRAGDLVILTAGTPFSRPGTTNMMKIVRLGGIEDIPGDGVATPFFRIELDQSCCNICGTCEKICPAGLFRSSNGAMLTVPENGEKCLGDKLCEKNCPTGAIKLLSLDAAQRANGKKD